MLEPLDRAKVVDHNFVRRVRAGDLPAATTTTTPAAAGLARADLLELFESQMISRHLDLRARLLGEQGRGYYTIGSSGHEGNAAIARAFRTTDMAFLHYRSGAFMVERSRGVPGVDAIYDHILSLVASAEEPIASGRHKVFGSLPLMVPPQTSTIASHLPKAVGAALSIAMSRGDGRVLPEDAVVLCSFGDASANHSTSLGAFNAAAWWVARGRPVPLVFVCEDNGIGISVETPSGWIERGFADRGMAYVKADGLDLADVSRGAREAERLARLERRPVFLHVRTVRLLGHAGSDIESVYRPTRDIEATEAQDPLLHSARAVLEHGWSTADQVIESYEAIRARVEEAARRAVERPKLTTAAEVMRSIVPPPSDRPLPALPDADKRAEYAARRGLRSHDLPLTMSQSINLALFDLLLRYDNALVFGEDVAKKGGVYRATVGLADVFGPDRVFDTLLDEQSILGAAIGLAHNGVLPVPEIQFLAYLHNAEDQVRGEAATLSFFSNGQFTNPMVIRIAGLPYQKGFGGHFHNDNSLAVLRDIPGIIVACPSTGADAARLLRTCFALAERDRRVVVFLEPIALYFTKDLEQAGDGRWATPYPPPAEEATFGEVGVVGDAGGLAIVTYGNGVLLARQAAARIAAATGRAPRIIDLMWLVPLPERSLLAALAGCSHVLVVDECRRSGSLSEALITLFVERGLRCPMARLTAEDSFIPLAAASNLVLPSVDGIVAAAAALLAR